MENEIQIKIDLGDYKKIAQKSKREKISVEEKEIEQALKWLQKSRAKLTLKNGPAEKGDFVEIEYQSPQIQKVEEKSAFVPKKRDFGEAKTDGFILGQGNLMPGFEEKIMGMEAGEEKEFFLDIPKDHLLNKRIGSDKINFKIKLNSVQNVELPEISDQFAKGLGNFESLEKLKENIKSGLNLEKEQAESQRLRNEILKNISEASKFEIPALLVEREQKAMLENFKKELKRMNLKFEDYLEKIKKSEQEILKSFENEARERLKAFLILKAIGEKEKIDVSDKEARDQANEILKNYPASEKSEKDIDFEQLKIYSREIIRNEKVFQILENFLETK